MTEWYFVIIRERDRTFNRRWKPIYCFCEHSW